MIARPMTALKLFEQLINEPTHIYISPKLSSSIDLVFIFQCKLLTESGVHLPLHQKCFLQIIYAKPYPKTCYPPPYKQAFWHYKYTNTHVTGKVIIYYPWERSLAG